MNSVEKIKELILNNEEAKKEFEEIIAKSQKDFADAIATLANKYDIVLTSKDLDYGSKELSEEDLTSIVGGSTDALKAWVSFKPFEENPVTWGKY